MAKTKEPKKKDRTPWLALFTHRGEAPQEPPARPEPEAETLEPPQQPEPETESGGEETKQPAQAAPAPEPEPEPSSPGATRLIVIAAALPSLLSLIWTAWSISDMLTVPAPVGLAVGVVFDLALVAAVVIAWHAPAAISRTAGIGAWVIACMAAVAVAVHGWDMDPAVAMFGAVPLISKLLWHLALASHRATLAADQHRDRVLSTDLTEQDQQNIADIYRRTHLTRQLGQAEAALTTAEAEADSAKAQATAQAEETRLETEHQMRRKAIQRGAQEQMDVQRANADLLKQRAELQAELSLAQPFALPAGPPQVPDDASSLEPAPGTSGEGGFAGFGSALQAVAATSTGTGLEQQVPVVPDAPGTHHSSAEAEANRRQVAAAYKSLLKAAAGEEPTIAAVARETGLSDRAAGRHLRALGLRD